MTEPSLEQETVSPLLLELARALRARQFYPPTHPNLKTILDRTMAIWREGLSKVEELKLELRGSRVLLPDGSPANGPGIDDVAKALYLRRAPRLRVHRDVEARELLALIDALAQPADSLEQLGELEQTLLLANVRHITTSEVAFTEHFKRVRMDGDAEEDCHPSTSPSPASPSPQPPQPTSPSRPKADVSPEKLRSEVISELIQLLAELEKCDEMAEYPELAAQIHATGPLERLPEWIRRHLHSDLGVEVLAGRVGMSPRNSARVFRRQFETTPARFVELARIERARRQLEEARLSLDQIADACGFGTSERMRRSFGRVLGVGPSAYRDRFEKPRARPLRQAG